MESNPQSVAALFSTREAADEAAGDLMTTGFKAEAITIAASASDEEDDTIHAPIIAPSGLVYSAQGTGPYPMSMTIAPGGIHAFELSKEESEFFSREMRPGHCLVVVRTGSQAEIARMVLERNGGHRPPGSSATESAEPAE